MDRHPLLTSILAGLALQGCGVREETRMCIEVDSSVTECPAPADVDVTTMFSQDECDLEAREVLGEGALSGSSFDTGAAARSLCCYDVVAVDPSPNMECQIGRPYLEGGAPVQASADATDPWTRMALAEHASIAAFARLTLSLMAHGAPAELLLAVQEAAADEVRHARDVFAGGWAGAFPFGEPIHVEPSLAALARSAYREGCLGETLGALLAAESARCARDPAVRALLEGIAADEARHAALSWRIVAWALARGGDAVYEALQGVESLAVAPMVAEDGREGEGLLGPSATRRIVEEAHTRVVEPALRALWARRPLIRPSATFSPVGEKGRGAGSGA